MNRLLQRPHLTAALAAPVLAAAALTALAPTNIVPAAQAAGPDCETSDGTVICTFTYTGSLQSFVVPAGVREVTVNVTGADGTAGTPGSGYGHAADVHAFFPVFPGETLQLMVGGRAGSNGRGGWNGGGTAGNADYPYGGGGGGASDVRRFGFRVVIAGGGGGGGSASTSTNAGTPGSGGNAGFAIPAAGGVAAGTGGTNATNAYVGGGGGGGGSASPGSGGGASGGSAALCAGDLVYAAGGNGGSSAAGGNGGFLHRANGTPCQIARGTGGGGGGGWAGGGGGGGGVTSGGGGGGGSSFGPAWSEGRLTSGWNDGLIQVIYEPPASS